MHNILVTGANGQLGSELRVLKSNYPTYNFIFTNSEQLDITTYRAVEKYIEQNAITAIINCAAYTAVDKAETDSIKANAINHLAVENLAKISKSGGIRLIHISTDYVFDGTSDRPYTEEDVPNAQSVYGKTKLAGEKAMQRVNPPNSIIIRTSWLYSNYGTNFVKTMLRLGKEKNEISVIADQKGTPTYANDLARTILEILPKLKNDKVEIYHYANEGVCSWYDFALAIFELQKIHVAISALETRQYLTPAKRPLSSVLNKDKIKETFELEIPYWRDSLAIFLDYLI
jgi:dTDP-4-dehydrorhamnose reductase